MPDLSIETFAETRARLDAGLELGPSLEAVSLDEAAWKSEGERLLAELADEAERGEFDRMRAFQAKYRETWTALTGAPPTLAEQAVGATSTAETSVKVQEALPPVPLSKASYQIAQERPAVQAAPRPPVGSTTENVDIQAIVASLPFKASSGPGVAPAARTPAPRVDTGTADVSADEVRRVAERLRGSGGATMFSPEAASPRAATPAVPFPEAKPAAPPQPAPPPVIIAKPSAPLGSTMFSPESAAPRVATAAVPFREGPRSPAPAGPASGKVSSEELRDVIARMSGASSGTMFSPDAAAPRAAAAAVPFRGGSSPKEESPESLRKNQNSQHLPTERLPDNFAFPAGAALMPLEEYARVSAVLTKEANPPATFARLGIQPDQWMAIVRAYSARFAADPALKQRFDGLMQQNLQGLR